MSVDKAIEAGAYVAGKVLDGSERAIREGFPSKVHWIREYRVRTGSGLRVALDAYESGRPMAVSLEGSRERGAGEMAVSLPDDLFSHHQTWRSALVAQRDAAKVEPPDLDDRAYWQHEIDVFDRVYADLAASRGTAKAPAEPRDIQSGLGALIQRLRDTDNDYVETSWVIKELAGLAPPRSV